MDSRLRGNDVALRETAGDEGFRNALKIDAPGSADPRGWGPRYQEALAACLFRNFRVLLKVRRLAGSARNDPMPNPLSRAKHNASINPQYNPSINPKITAAINPNFNPWINPNRNSRIHPGFNQALNPLVTASLNPTRNWRLDLKLTHKYSGLRRLNPEADLVGYVVLTSHKAVLLFFDKDLNWTSYIVDNSQQGYNVFDLEGTWQGYVLKNQARGWNEFNLQGDWLGFIAR
jgi:hypothetical protein